MRPSHLPSLAAPAATASNNCRKPPTCPPLPPLQQAPATTVASLPSDHLATPAIRCMRKHHHQPTCRTCGSICCASAVQTPLTHLLQQLLRLQPLHSLAPTQPLHLLLRSPCGCVHATASLCNAAHAGFRYPVLPRQQRQGHNSHAVTAVAACPTVAGPCWTAQQVHTNNSGQAAGAQAAMILCTHEDVAATTLGWTPLSAHHPPCVSEQG